ncbi:hypothetical protein TNCV_1688701 [Trichonephila clavipes]|nr:hypothetical protein TNCV_1688701 [Trichonephila clavipes]
MDSWYQRLWKSITSIFRIGEKETFTPVNMIECMEGKPLSDKSIQDCLFNNQPTLPEKPIEKNEKLVKDSIDSAKEEPECVLETRKRNERDSNVTIPRVHPFDNKQVEIRPTLESLHSFTYQDIVKNLKYYPSLLEDSDGWDRSDIVRVAQEELQHFLKYHLLKEYLERDNHGWTLVIGATDFPTYMYLDHIIPEVMHYIGKEHQAEM